MSALSNGAFRHKRYINGVRVLVKAEMNADGITHESFIVRFLLPGGKVDKVVDGLNYYWQAFNEAKRMMNSGAV